MKAISYILILLMTVMVFAPCRDAFEVETSQMTQVVEISSHTIILDYGMDGKDEHNEACSPLCPCQCCPSVASDTPGLSELRLTSPALRIVQKKLNLFTILPDIIWSPPQLLS